MTIFLWLSLASVAVSVFVGAFLQHGRHETETLDLDLESATFETPQPGVPVDSP